LSHIEKHPKDNNQNSFDDDVNKAELDDENNKQNFHFFFFQKIILCITHTM